MKLRLSLAFGAFVALAGWFVISRIHSAGLSVTIPRCAWEMVVGDTFRLSGPLVETPYGELQFTRITLDWRNHPGLFRWGVQSFPSPSRGLFPDTTVLTVDSRGLMRAVAPGIARLVGTLPGPFRVDRPAYEDIYVRPTTLRAIALWVSRDTIAVRDTFSVRFALIGNAGDTLAWSLRPPSTPYADPEDILSEMPWGGPAKVFTADRPGTGTIRMCIGSRHAERTIVVR